MCGRRPICFVMFLLGLIVCGQLRGFAAEEFDKEGLEFFEKHIRPLFVDRCYKCHSEKAETVEADLYVDSREGLLKGGDQGPAIEPGEPSRSLLIQAVKYEMDDLKMPPDRRLEEEQIANLEKWVKMGAPAPRRKESAAKNPPDSSNPKTPTTWAFQAPVSQPSPTVKRHDWPNSLIDRFILAKLDEVGLQPAQDAEKRILLRRLTFDLTGLPPTPEELVDFIDDQRPDAASRLVDRLLASPRYGERWGRHWMDVVRYADTAGDNSDYPIPQMYKYRNWIIEAWNSDLPYDEFIRQQLAGDLLPAASQDDRHPKIIATGYLANARRFGSRVDDYPQHLTIEDTIDNLGRTFLGLTVNCARCHDHKFDPISNEDYYGLYGFFHSTRYPWPGIELEKKQRDFVPLVPQAVVEAASRERGEREKQLSTQLKERESAKAEADRLVREATEAAASTNPAAEMEPASKEPTASKEDSRSKEEIASKLKQLQDKAAAAAKELQQAKQALEAQKQSPLPYETAYAVAEAAKIEDVYVQIKGDPERPGTKVRRRFPIVLGGQTLLDDDKSSGRLALAKWLSDPSNPLTARVIVNRLWSYHFGRGIVGTPSDFGKQGRPPTHPELLDYLARQLIESDWSLKSLQRRLVLTRTYQMASNRAPIAGEPDPEIVDPANDRWWHYPRRRLDAESIRDAILACADNLDQTPGGPHPFPKQSAWDFTQHKPFRAVYESNRRSVYLMTQRIQRHPYLAIFDGPDTSASTAARVTSTTTLQALYLLNDEFVHTQAEHLARRLGRERDSDEARVDLAFSLLFSRPPTTSERDTAIAYVRDSAVPGSEKPANSNDLPHPGWSSLSRAMLRLNEFVYID